MTVTAKAAISKKRSCFSKSIVSASEEPLGEGLYRPMQRSVMNGIHTNGICIDRTEVANTLDNNEYCTVLLHLRKSRYRSKIQLFISATALIGLPVLRCTRSSRQRMSALENWSIPCYRPPLAQSRQLMKLTVQFFVHYRAQICQTFAPELLRSKALPMIIFDFNKYILSRCI